MVEVQQARDKLARMRRASPPPALPFEGVALRANLNMMLSHTYSAWCRARQTVDAPAETWRRAAHAYLMVLNAATVAANGGDISEERRHELAEMMFQPIR